MKTPRFQKMIFSTMMLVCLGWSLAGTPVQSAWQAVGSGMDSAVFALALGSDSTLYAGGLFTTAGGVEANYVASWNGSTWQALGSSVNDQVNDLALGSDGALYAGGLFIMWNGSQLVYHVASWNGSTWQALNLMGTLVGVNDDVYALALGSGTLYVGGAFDTAFNRVADDVAANYVARWNESTNTWQALGSGMGGDTYPLPPSVSALALGSDGTLYAGGNFTTAGGVAANYVARWNGTAWQALGSGMNDTVYALALGSDGTLYAGGRFTTAGGVAANYVARWNGSAWQALGSGMGGGTYSSVTALALGSDGTLYAGGDFTTAGGVTANYVARWNGSAWQALGSGMNRWVQALAVGSDGALYAGGAFTTADGAAANYIAQWTAGQTSNSFLLWTK